MATPRTDDEINMVERIILYAMQERVVTTNVERAVEIGYKTYMKELANNAKDDYKAFKKYIIAEINKRRAPVVDNSDIQDYLPHGGLPLGDPRYKGDRKRASDQEMRNKLIRLAHQNPELREHILPLVREATSNPVEVIEDILAFYKDFQALINDRKHRDFAKSHAKMLGKVLNDLNKELGEIDGYYQLGYTPMTRRSSDKKQD